MHTIKIKNLTQSVMLLGHDLHIDPEGELSLSFPDYQKVAAVVTSFVKSGWAKISEGEAEDAVKPSPEELQAVAQRKQEIKGELLKLQKEFKDPKTDAARKEEIANLVNGLKDEAKKLK